MSKYKLLRDMPGIPAGTILRQTNGGRLVREDSTFFRISKSVEAEKYPDWFELLPDQPVRWRAARDNDYFVITLSDHGSLVISSQEECDTYDEARYKIGNYFRTEKQAQAVADAIKAVLTWVHDPKAEKIRALSDGSCLEMYSALNTAREALQPESKE